MDTVTTYTFFNGFCDGAYVGFQGPDEPSLPVGLSLFGDDGQIGEARKFSRAPESCGLRCRALNDPRIATISDPRLSEECFHVATAQAANAWARRPCHESQTTEARRHGDGRE